MSERRVLKPSGRRTAFRFLLGAGVLVFAIGGTASGAWQLGVPLILVGLFLWAMTACILFVPRAYELHLDDQGFRVHDLFGRPVHDVPWSEVVSLHGVHGLPGLVVVGWLRSPRPPRQGRIRWRRGTKTDDGCMPDHYGNGKDPSELLALMSGYWERGGRAVRSPAGAPTDLSAF